MNMSSNYLSGNATVLLVDDEPDILELLELALRKMGLEVDRAGNVREALAKLAARRYDLCLTDMRMPDGDGLQVVQHITQHNLDVPVAVITATGTSRLCCVMCCTTCKPSPSGIRISVKHKS